MPDNKEESVDPASVEWQRRPRLHPSALTKPERLAELAQFFGSTERLELFKQVVAVYRKKPTLENYLRLRREIPEAEIDVGLFGGIDALFALEPELLRHGIDPQLVAGTLEARPVRSATKTHNQWHHLQRPQKKRSRQERSERYQGQASLVFDIVGEMGFEELGFNVFIPAAVLLTGFLGLFLMMRL